MQLDRSLMRQLAVLLATSNALFASLMHAPAAVAADDRAAVSTINHAFATELGTGIYDIGGRSIFVVGFTPEWELRAPQKPLPGVRLVLPITAGSFDFMPDDALEGVLPSRIDSFSLMPGLEFDFPLRDDWVLTPWLRAGASFAAGTSDGWLYGTGVRATRSWDMGKVAFTRHHDAGVVVVDYRSAQPNDLFLRMRNALDVRRPTLALSHRHRLLAGLYGILDIVPDPPAAPEDVGKPSVVQLEVGFTLNTDPRVKIGPLRWPRLGLGYRMAGDFSGWRIVFGAPF
jgi:hypothetical protein